MLLNDIEELLHLISRRILAFRLDIELLPEAAMPVAMVTTRDSLRLKAE